MTRLFLSMLLAALVAGCAGPSRREQPPEAVEDKQEAYEVRSETLRDKSNWSLAARLGIDAGDEGGSGRLDWTVQESSSVLNFRGTLGRGAWQLDLDRESATLKLADGTVIRNHSVQDLIADETGLEIPVEALHWWVRGLASPGSEHLLELDDHGLPTGIAQDGWTIRIEKYMEFDGLMMPRKLEANRENYTVKLAISRWSFTGENDGA